jgi:hypothetical protein
MKFGKLIPLFMIFILIGSDIVALKTEIRRGRHTRHLSNRSSRSRARTQSFESIDFLFQVLLEAGLFQDVIEAIKKDQNPPQIEYEGQQLQCSIGDLTNYYNSQLRVPFSHSPRISAPTVQFDTKENCNKFYEEALFKQKEEAENKLNSYNIAKNEFKTIIPTDLIFNPKQIRYYPIFEINYKHKHKLNQDYTIEKALELYPKILKNKIRFYKTAKKQAIFQKNEYDNFNKNKPRGERYCDVFESSGPQEEDKVSFKQKLLAVWKTSSIIYLCSNRLGITLENEMSKVVDIAINKVIELVADIFTGGFLTLSKVIWHVIKLFWYFSKSIYYKLNGENNMREYYENYGLALGNAMKIIMDIVKVGKRKRMMK